MPRQLGMSADESSVGSWLWQRQIVLDWRMKCHAGFHAYLKISHDCVINNKKMTSVKCTVANRKMTSSIYN